jgi:hypothetical protein
MVYSALFKTNPISYFYYVSKHFIQDMNTGFDKN